MTAGVFSFGFLVSAVVTPFVGRLMDRRGPRLVIELGIVAMTAGLLLAPLARTPRQLDLSLGALVGGGVNCLAYTGQSFYLPIGSCGVAGSPQRRLFGSWVRFGDGTAVFTIGDRGTAV